MSSNRALKLKNLILSFSDSKFYHASSSNFKDGSTVHSISIKKKVLKDAKFFILLKIHAPGFGIATRLDQGKPEFLDNCLTFVLSTRGHRVLSNEKPSWLPTEPIRYPDNGLFSNEWVISNATFDLVYDEAIQILQTAKELEKQGLYFEGSWTPSVCKKRWVVSNYTRLCYPVSRKEYKRMVFDLYTKLVLEVVAEKTSKFDTSFYFDHEKASRLRDKFVEEAYRDKLKYNESFREHVRNRVLKDLFD